ncbi:MAG TPA: rhomboid family intramembrane serine protease [Gemmataceae bacterium]|jgi:membrane associated rhomboid family serine protease|nr:rhomboid family intramembrane serine protease [Gemmataceae bacterium]
MGIYDRDYYREDSRWGNPFARSQATILLVILYVGLYVAQIASREDAPRIARNQVPVGKMTETLQLDPEAVFRGEVWRVASYALVHDPWHFWHVVFTGVFLAWIGHQVEDLYGWKEYVAFFVLTTLIGGVVYCGVAALAPDVPVLLGPSGAVTAILVLFALHYPSRTISVFFFLPVPVWLIVAVYAVLDVSGMSHGTANPAAVAVHAAGAAFAFLYHTYTLRVLNWLPSRRERTARRTPAPRVRVPREQPQPEPAAAAAAQGAAGGSSVGGFDEHLEAKLDEVLAKVTKFGKESLTDSERDILLRASEIYKKRRQSS